jgi:hypothetical protein
MFMVAVLTVSVGSTGFLWGFSEEQLPTTSVNAIAIAPIGRKDLSIGTS